MRQITQKESEKARRKFEKLYKRHREALLKKLSRRYAYLQQVVEDSVVEAFMRLWQRMEESGAVPVNCGGWLWRVARNYLVDQIKSAFSQHKTLSPEKMEEVAVYESELELEKQECREERIRREIAALPAIYRDVCQRRIECEWTYEQIVQELGCTYDAARHRLSRGREILRHRLADLAPPPVRANPAAEDDA